MVPLYYINHIKLTYFLNNSFILLFNQIYLFHLDRLSFNLGYADNGIFNKIDQTNNFEITFANNVKQRLDDVKVIKYN